MKTYGEARNQMCLTTIRRKIRLLNCRRNSNVTMHVIQGLCTKSRLNGRNKMEDRYCHNIRVCKPTQVNILSTQRQSRNSDKKSVRSYKT